MKITLETSDWLDDYLTDEHVRRELVRALTRIFRAPVKILEIKREQPDATQGER